MNTRILILLIITLFVAVSPASASESLTWLETADSLYQEALLSSGTDREILAQRVAAIYEEAIFRGEYWNGYALYNLATAYHLSGDLGRAILNYRRAQQYIPGFSDLEANLTTALNQRIDKPEPGQKAEIMRALFFWHYLLGTATRRTVFVVSFVAVWVFLAFNSFRSSGVARTLAGVSLVISCIIGISVGSDYIQSVKKNRGVIVAKEIVARKGPGTGYSPAYEGGLHEGTEFKLLEHDRGWFRVRLIDGVECWLPEGSFDTY